MLVTGTFLLTFLLGNVNSEVYTSISEMERVLETQSLFLESFNEYIQQEQKQLLILKSRYNLLRAEYNKAQFDTKNYVANPINALKVLKNTFFDWNHIEKHCSIASKEFFIKMSDYKTNYSCPTMEDFKGAVDGLLRLQKLYNLSTADLAQGVLNGVKYSDPMPADVCYEIGVVIFDSKKYPQSHRWFIEALDRYDANTINKKHEIYEYLAFDEYILGNYENAISWSLKVLEKQPNNARVRRNLPLYNDLLLKRSKLVHDNANKDSTSFRNYEELCRDDLDIPEYLKKDLKCYFLNHTPFLKLAPLKVEQVYKEPNIVVYHDVLYEREIKQVYNIVKTRLQRSKVVGDLKTSVRTSQNTWLRDDAHRVVGIINRRVIDMTGLSLTTAEEYQVANYGIGGHYEPHFDFSKGSNFTLGDEFTRGIRIATVLFYKEDEFNIGHEEGKGNRIATVLFYMTDVPQGGRTVFPHIGVGVSPRKGTAVLWYNLHPSGEGDEATLHAACPVLQGNKWVLNKWIRFIDQEFRRPCNLQYQEEGFIKEYPDPILKTAA